MNGSAELETNVAVEWFENFYQCSECGTNWTDEWSCKCDDRCPRCDAEMEPLDSTDFSRPLSAEDYRAAASIMFDSPNLAAWISPEEAARNAVKGLERG